MAAEKKLEGIFEGEIPCRSCPQKDWECFPAVAIATTGKMEWPVCRMHERWAMVAGWFPITPIEEARTKEAE